jgi:hypothetical protein
MIEQIVARRDRIEHPRDAIRRPIWRHRLSWRRFLGWHCHPM